MTAMDALTTHADAFEIKSDPAEGADADLVTKALDDFRATVDDRLAALETKSAADAKVAERLKALETRLSRPGAGVEIKSADDKAAFERKAFLSYVRHGVERMPADEAKSLTVATGASAGYLVPPQFSVELLKYLVQFSPIRAYAKVMQVSGQSITFPRRTSILAATWVGETAARTESQPTFDQLTIANTELATFVDVSNQLLEDNAYDLESELANEFGLAFAQAEGVAFVNGTGAGQPMGLLTSPQITSMPSAAAGKVGLADIIGMFHAIPSAWAQQGVWVLNRTTMASLRGILDSLGRPIFLDAVSSTAPSSLLGRPIVEAIDMPNVASGATPILFGDLGGYRIVDRVGLSTLRDPFTQAAVGQTRLHARKRTGADVVDGKRFIKLTVA